MLVEVREVLEVGDLPRAPQLGERRDVAVLQQVGQVRGQDVVVDVVAELGRKTQTTVKCFLSIFPVPAPERHVEGQTTGIRNLNDAV